MPWARIEFLDQIMYTKILHRVTALHAILLYLIAHNNLIIAKQLHVYCKTNSYLLLVYMYPRSKHGAISIHDIFCGMFQCLIQSLCYCCKLVVVVAVITIIIVVVVLNLFPSYSFFIIYQLLYQRWKIQFCWYMHSFPYWYTCTCATCTCLCPPLHLYLLILVVYVIVFFFFSVL